MKLQRMATKHPVLSYFVITFAVSLTGFFIIVGFTGLPGTTAQTEKFFPISLISLLFSPVISGVFLTGFIYGKKGLRHLLSRCLSFNQSLRWYFVAIFTVPIITIVVLFFLSQISSVYVPAVWTVQNKAVLIFTGIGIGIMGGLFEELGWTGFAVPELRKRFGVLTTGLILGFIWGVWHIPITLWASGDVSGMLSLALFMPPFFFYMLVLPVFRVLMVWFFNRTDNLFLTILMHASLTASTLFIFQPPAIGKDLTIYYIILTVVLLTVTILIVFIDGYKISGRKPN